MLITSRLLSVLLTLGAMGGTAWTLVQGVHVLHPLAPKESLLAVVASACSALSLLSYVSPIGAVLDLVSAARNPSAGPGPLADFPIAVIACQALQCVSSVAYGMLIDNTAIVATNGAGLVFQSFWLVAWFYARQQQGPRSLRRVPPVLVGTALPICSVGLIWSLTRLPRTVVGPLSCVLSVVLCLSPLAKLGLVVRTRRCAAIPVAMTLISCASNAVWTVYGILLDDAVVLLPSLLGFAVTTFQILLSLWCAHRLPFDLAFLQLIFRPLPNASGVVATKPTTPEAKRGRQWRSVESPAAQADESGGE